MPGTAGYTPQGPEGKVYATQAIAGIGPEWKRYTVSFESSGGAAVGAIAMP